MSRTNADLDEIFERLAVIEGSMDALQTTLLYNIAGASAVLRHHSADLADDLEKVIADLPVPPNAQARRKLQDLCRQIRNISAGHGDQR